MKRAKSVMTAASALIVAVPLMAVPLVSANASATSAVSQPSTRALPSVRPVPWVSGLSQPTSMATSPTGWRYLVTEQVGRIRLIQGATLAAAPFLDVTDRVASGGETGLLGVAYSPRFATDRFIFFTYTDGTGALVLARAQAASTTAMRADRSTVRTVLRVPHPDYSNHNGGSLTFDKNGLLYLGTGDGGSGGDPNRNALNLNRPLGKILRVDVSRACHGRLYCIPASNTYATSTSPIARLVWARGVRNPWKITTDSGAGGIWIGDVGQNQYEEVNTALPSDRALNFGWSCREGNVTYNSDQCGSGRGRAPLTTLCHQSNVPGCRPPLVGNSITGGFIYRGTTKPGLAGAFVFADFVTGRVFALGGGSTRQIAALEHVSAFGQMPNRELLAVGYSSGVIYRLA